MVSIIAGKKKRCQRLQQFSMEALEGDQVFASMIDAGPPDACWRRCSEVAQEKPVDKSMLLFYKDIFIRQSVLDLCAWNRGAEAGLRMRTSADPGVIASLSAGAPLESRKTEIDKRHRARYICSLHDELLTVSMLDASSSGDVFECLDSRELKGALLLPIDRIVDPGEVRRKGVL